MDDQTERMYGLMRKESNRLKTFQMNPPWPKDSVDIRKLAKAGFFYAFNGDNVHCAFCRGQVCRWDREDDPMTEHAKHFTTCPFIMGGDVGNEPLGKDPFPGPKRPRPYDVCGIYSNPPTLNEPRSMLNQYDRNPSEQQSESNNYQSGNHNQLQPNQNSIFNIEFQNQHISQQLSLSNQQNSITHQMPSLESLGSERNNQNSLNSSHSSCSNSPNSLSGICKICYTNSIELVFLPCGHSVSCLSCAQRLLSCPCCRATITTRIRTFLV